MQSGYFEIWNVSPQAASKHFYLSQAPHKVLQCVQALKSYQVVSMKKYLSGCSYMCHHPAELSSPWKGEGFLILAVNFHS